MLTMILDFVARGALSRGLAVALLAGGLLGGCATVPDPQADPEGYEEYVETNDPAEPFNRAVFKFNRGFDKAILTPMAIFYRDILPPIMQQGVHNFLNNLESPVIFVNDVLQGDLGLAGNTLGRLVINSTLGLGGLADVASHFGMERHPTDFGQTLALWDVDEGMYLMLPILGPTNPRDAIGRGIDSAIFDPFGLLSTAVFDTGPIVEGIAYTRTGLTAVNLRARALEPLDELERSSLDLYAAIRSAYRQNRRFEIEKRRRLLGEEPQTESSLLE